MYALGHTLWTKWPRLQGDDALSNPRFSPIDIVAMAIQFVLFGAITNLDNLDVFLTSCLSESIISKKVVAPIWKWGQWQEIWILRIQVESTIRKLRAALASEQWSKGHAPIVMDLLQEYTISLDHLRSFGGFFEEDIQQVNGMTSVEETRRGMQQADSIRR
jgi:hypothetical protein